ncbi:MAG: response regulator [Pseudobdellovibrionaceae bacterium]
MFPTKTRILIVDDMPSIRDLVRNHLQGMGYKFILEANNGEEGLKILQESNSVGNQIQLIISDLNMPVLNGVEFLKKVRASATWASLPFILLTSESERELVTEAILSGVSQYVVKPFTGKMFEEKLKTVWAKYEKAA